MERNNNRRDGENTQRERRDGARPRKQINRGRSVQDDREGVYHTNYNRDSDHSSRSNHQDSDRPRRSYGDREGKPAGERRSYGNREGRPAGERRSYGDREGNPSYRDGKSAGRGSKPGMKGRKPAFKGKKPTQPPYFKGQLAPLEPTENLEGMPKKPTYAAKGLTRLNKFISNAGICSRRDADKLIEAGSVTVNGEVVTQMGYLVKETDVVAYGGETLRSEAKRYFLLNKPKGYITTLDDPQERQTVMELMSSACRERIYPVGRLDRNTTGLLLFTNDGEMAKKLTHPSTGVYKVYKVELDKAVSQEDMQHMLDGIELEDGVIAVDDVAYDYNPAEHKGIDKRIVGVQIHSGKNRIVRRIFESMGYTVHKLDRTVFAGLTKKDLPRGRYRELTDREVNFLKMV